MKKCLLIGFIFISTFYQPLPSFAEDLNPKCLQLLTQIDEVKHDLSLMDDKGRNAQNNLIVARRMKLGAENYYSALKTLHLLSDKLNKAFRKDNLEPGKYYQAALQEMNQFKAQNQEALEIKKLQDELDRLSFMSEPAYRLHLKRLENKLQIEERNSPSSPQNK